MEFVVKIVLQDFINQNKINVKPVIMPVNHVLDLQHKNVILVQMDISYLTQIVFQVALQIPLFLIVYVFNVIHLVLLVLLQLNYALLVNKVIMFIIINATKTVLKEHMEIPLICNVNPVIFLVKSVLEEVIHNVQNVLKIILCKINQSV
jgi:hypothetical protein